MPPWVDGPMMGELERRRLQPVDPLRTAIERLRREWRSLSDAQPPPPPLRSRRPRRRALQASPFPSRRSAGSQGLHPVAGAAAVASVATSVRPLAAPALPGSALPRLLLEAIHLLREAGLPLDRLSLALVPEQSGFHGSQHQWSVDEPKRLRSFLRLYEFFQGPDHRTSVLHHVCCTGRPERVPLQENPAEAIPFPLLRDLRRDHFHDYLALPLPPSGSHRVVLTLATRRRGGFTPDQLGTLRRVLPDLRRLLQSTDHFGLGRWESRDPLTALASRHRLLQHLSRTITAGRAASRSPVAVGDRPLTLLLLDLEAFGAYNRVFGSFVADDALVAVARQLESLWGDQAGVIARIGSDSFALLLQGPQGEALAGLAGAVQDGIRDLRLAHPPFQDPFLSASLAALTWSRAESDGDDAPQERARVLLAAAETLLEMARQAPGAAIRLARMPEEDGIPV